MRSLHRFVPIVAWLFVMVALLLESMGVSLSHGDMFAPILFLVVAWGYALFAIPVSFLTAHNPMNDQSFLWLRIIAMVNLVAPIYAART